MTDALDYEHFVCNAFATKQRQAVGRYGDPATLADTDVFITSNLSRVKAATIYAMEIYRTEVQNSGHITDPVEDARLDAFADSIISATSLAAISTKIKEFEQTVIGKYYVLVDGFYTLR